MIQPENVGKHRDLGLLSFLSFRFLSHPLGKEITATEFGLKDFFPFFPIPPRRGDKGVGGWKERKKRKEIYNYNIFKYLLGSFFPYLFPVTRKEIMQKVMGRLRETLA